jgi:quercetin dioxygenase-like cupin family protein
MGSVIHTPSGAEKKDLEVVGEVIHVLADAAQTGSYEVFEQHGPDGAGPPPHTHPWDEAYFMLDGEMEVLLGERTVVLKKGDFVHVPAGVPHCFRYRGHGRFVSVTSRAGAARFFTELAAALPAGAPPDVPKMIEVALRNDVRPLGPPPG